MTANPPVNVPKGFTQKVEEGIQPIPAPSTRRHKKSCLPILIVIVLVLVVVITFVLVLIQSGVI
jgi:t-SNARE complex subunit (syntaxin)